MEDVAPWLITAVGAVIVLAALRDVFHTLWHPGGRGGLPDALYLSMVTVATLGFGDIVPIDEWMRIAVRVLAGEDVPTATRPPAGGDDRDGPRPRARGRALVPRGPALRRGSSTNSSSAPEAPPHHVLAADATDHGHPTSRTS